MRKKTDQRPRGNPPDSSSQTLGLIANDLEPRQSAGAEPVLDNLSHRTSRDSVAPGRCGPRAQRARRKSGCDNSKRVLDGEAKR